MTLDAGLNGFGRFGLHLLRHWLDRRDDASFRIVALNDSQLSVEQARRILIADPDVAFDDFAVSALDGSLILTPASGRELYLRYSRGVEAAIPWLGEVDLLLEASGRNTGAGASRELVCGRTRQVVVSASTEDADQTLVFGFNHRDWSPRSRLLSYGSCTVNAFVPLAAWLHDSYGVHDADLNVVHNMPRYRLRETLERRDCTLETWGPRLLPWLAPEAFHVNYTMVPFPGVSMLDFRFRLARVIRRNELLSDLRTALEKGRLAGLYRLDATASSLESYLGATWNAILIADRLRVRGDQLYLHALCDTEGSAARYFDLVDYAARRLLAAAAKPAEPVPETA